MPASIDGYGFQAEIDGGEMGACGDAGFSQDGPSKQPAELGRVLKHRKFAPGVDSNERS